jgi:hypothetical protein
MDDARGGERLAVLRRPFPGSFERRVGGDEAASEYHLGSKAAWADEFRADWPSQQ